MKLTAFLFFVLIVFSYSAQTNFQEHVLETSYINGPWTVHSADIDGDGFKDVLSGDHESVSCFLNHGDGSFGTQRVVRQTTSRISDISTADFDGDGDLDVVSTSHFGGLIVWNENLGNGEFSLNRLIDSTHQSHSLQTGDLDNDGDQDIAVASNSSDKVGWYKNLGGGYFTTFLPIATFTDILDIKLNDLNNDGLPDLICFAENTYQVIHYRNMGNGIFVSQGSVTATSVFDIVETVFTDSDNDNDTDLAVTFENSTWLYLNDGSGNFGAGTQIYAYQPITSLVATDIDNDGDEDIVYSHGNVTNSHEVGYLRNNGNGIPYTRTGNINKKYFTMEVFVDDFDNDGLMDICSGASSEDKIVWYKNLGEDLLNLGEFIFSEANVISSNLLSKINQIDCRDYDGDGDLDILASSQEANTNGAEYTNSRISFYENEGNEQFSAQQVITQQMNHLGYTKFRLGDLDGDGDMDLVSHSSNDAQIMWRKNTGTTNFTALPIEISTWGSEEVSDSDLGDMAQDADLDIVCFVDYTFFDGPVDLIRWYRNLGNGVYTSPMVINSNLNFVIDAHVADLDQDGDMDLLAVSSTTGKLVMHKQEAGLTFSPEIIIDATNTHYPEVGDLNADGIPDIVVGSHYPLQWYRGLGGGNFAPKEHITQAPFYSYWMEKTADINQDGKLDIVFAMRDIGKLGWLENIDSICLPITTILEDTICMGSSYTFNGMNLTEQGTYTASFLRTNMCDSLVVLNLRLSTIGCTPVACSELYISEYIHGTASNKAIEFYNPTNDPIDLDYYSLRIYFDGSIYYQNIPLTGTIPANGTFVIAHPSAAAGILAQAGLTNSLLTFNGDDAIELIRNFSRIDLIGQIGFDPGTAWVGAAGTSTSLKTMIRKSTVTSGLRINATYQPGTHFTALAQNTFSNLGQHTTFCQTILCNTNSDIAAEICAGDSYLFAGQPRSEAGIYYDTLINSTGCDSIIRLDLSMAPTLHFVNETICSNSFYPFNNTNLQTPGIYFDTLPNMQGCDSVVKLVLAVNPVATSILNQTICAGESIIVNGNVYSTSVNGATEIFAGAGANGCDSIVTINLQVLPPVVSTQNHTACGSYTWINGVTYTSDNNTASHLIPNGSATGCDSTIYLNLTINSPSTGIETRTECQSYTWINGVTYTASNTTATHTIPGGNSHNCDSTVTLNLTILPAATGTDIRTECQSYTWINGITYTNSNNTATHTLSNSAANGCDSIVTLNLTLLQTATGTDTQSDCQPLTWIDGNLYTSSNTTATYTFVNGAVNGCDSIVTLQFTLLPASQGTDIVFACEPYTWIDGITYSTDNNSAVFTIENGAANGCDSTAHLSLTVEILNTTVSGASNTLSADLPGVDYQWINCTTGQLIPGATGQTFVASEVGNYAVILSTINCEDTSVCIEVNEIIGLGELSSNTTISLFPNPATEAATLVFSKKQTAELFVYDHLGKVVYDTHF